MTTSNSPTDAMRERLRKLIPEGGKDGPTQGVNHIAVFAKDLETTAKFYEEIMDMPVVSVAPNRDVEESTHMNVAIGNGMRLSFFDFPHVPRLRKKAPEGVGNVMHIALPIARNSFLDIKGRCDQAKIKYQEVGGAIYVKDPNGLAIELMPFD
ncbi:MAG TPA: VOC family protein [Dehalococcoidia bacterium]|nr:VOC family protein [Dehalococcoidia bacterium]HIF42756.1 VOC family protein [Dehalococcoidia bacterium]HIL31105.1 VOC family protein [Dehalococcoidia bacterium]|tara:strand:- start:1943 stop:2401 length:459 start_codon:yes stop_codon:yes gene_type:complete